MDGHNSLNAAINGPLTYAGVASVLAKHNTVEFSWANSKGATVYQLVLSLPSEYFSGVAWHNQRDKEYMFLGIRDNRIASVRVGPTRSTSETLVDINTSFGKLAEGTRSELAVLLVNVSRITRELKAIAARGGVAPDTATSLAPVAQAIEAARDEFGFKLTLPE